MEANVVEANRATSSDFPITMSTTTADEVRQQQAGNDDQKRRVVSSADNDESHPPGKSRKRRKKAVQPKSSPDINSIRSEAHKSAESLRRQGISPNTLFFSSLPDDIKRDDNLRTVIGVPLEDLRTTHVRGKKVAWARFATESDCLDSLIRVRLAKPAAKVSIHRPKKITDPNGMSMRSNNLKIFEKRLEEVRGNGGVGNTLMFRNLPKEVDCDELREVLRDAMEKAECEDRCLPLRIRTALSKNGSGRNFWVVYSTVNSCQTAFVAIHLTSVSFRCGRTMKLHAFVHDDSTDADEKRRRERAIDLGVQRNTPASEATSAEPKVSNLELLEDFLRQNQTSFVFMSPKSL